MKNKKLVQRPLPFIFALSCLLLLLAMPASAQNSAPQLRDLIIFQDESYGGWAGSGGDELNAPNAFLPTDTAEMNNGFPSYNVNFSGGQWWAAILPGPSWERYSISPYVANGVIEFSARGELGGEQFAIGLRDSMVSRFPADEEGSTDTETITLTAEWQDFQVSLNDILNDAFEPNNMYLVALNGVGSGALNFWINDIKITSPDTEMNAAGIKVNQLGYVPNGNKVAVDSDWSFTAAPSWQVDGESVSGGSEVTTEMDPVVSGEQVRHYDFSALETVGAYTISADGSNSSAQFTVGEDVFDELLVDSMRYFMFQRQGIALDATSAGVFERGVGHPLDVDTELQSGGRSWDVSQGWYDAGDYGKYVNAGAVAVSDLLWAYELYPDEFFDGQNNLPAGESSNGMPDILDEIKWETDWLLKMQDTESGGFYHMVKGGDENLFPTNNPEPRNIVDVDASGNGNVRPTASTASTIAALAHASLVFRPFDAAYADQLLASAEYGWDYLEANPNGVNAVPGPYADSDDADDRFWAAGELFRATGTAKYGDYIEANYTTDVHRLNETNDNAYFVGGSGLLGVLAYVYADNQDADVQAYFEAEFAEWTLMMVGRYEDSHWNIALEDADFFWGSNMQVLNTPLAMIVGAKAFGTETTTHFDIAHAALDYVLGVNPLGFSYVSGQGDNSVENIFSNIWAYDEIAEIPPGYVAGGPNEYTNPLMYSNFAAKRYVDNDGSWTTNEHTVYWNSPLVFVAAAVADGATSTTSIPTSTTLTTQTTTLPTVAIVVTILIGLVAAGTLIIARSSQD